MCQVLFKTMGYISEQNKDFCVSETYIAAENLKQIKNCCKTEID